MAGEAKRLERVKRLLEKARELHTLQAEILEETRKIIAGEEAIGDLMRRLSDSWLVAWQQRYRSKYAWSGVKDSTAAKRLLKDFTVEDLVARAGRYLADADPFYTRQRHPFALFATNINRYADTAPAELELEASTVFDCKHSPRCRNDQQHTRRSVTALHATA